MNNEEMKNKIERLEERIRGLERDLDDVSQELDRDMRVRRAICELQEHLRDKGDFYPINRINAPTRVGME
jgi:archaellum component FlaC